MKFELKTLAIASTLAIAGPVSAQEVKVAFFGAAASNGYTQAIFAGMQERAAELGGVEVTFFDGEFNAALQYAQVEDVVASGNFQGYVIFPNDSVGIAGAIAPVTAAGAPFATVGFPIGPNLDSLEPQVPGMTATVIYQTELGSVHQAEAVVEFCADKDPCKVTLLIGFMASSFDNLRLQTYRRVLAEHPNIEVVAEVEGQYSPDVSLTAMQDVLQSHPDVNAVISVGDQQIIGAEIAFETAGIPVEPVFLSGLGASEIGLTAIREGRWDNSLLHLPASMGREAVDAVVASLRGETVDGRIDMETVTDLPPLIDLATLEANPDFNGEWVQ